MDWRQIQGIASTEFVTKLDVPTNEMSERLSGFESVDQAVQLSEIRNGRVRAVQQVPC